MRLNFIKETGTEVKTAGIFAAAALVISLLTGFLSGIVAGTVLLRSFFSLVIFACLGFCAAWVLKKFVPELGTVFSGSSDDSDEAMENVQNVSGPEDDFGSEQADVQTEVLGSGDGNSEFSEFRESDFPSVSSTGSSSDDDQSFQNVSMGKHIVSNEENSFGYDSETMAKAVRTMIKKDE